MARNNAIGRDNRLLWHLPDDLKHFRETTMGHYMVMGRRTYESIGRPLPGRTTIVLSREGGIAPMPRLLRASSIEEALALPPAGEEVFVLGGAKVYQQTIGIAERLVVTRIDADFEADAFFPSINPSEWQLAFTSERHYDPSVGNYWFEQYVRP